MQVVEFPQPVRTADWDADELRVLAAACEAEIAKGRAAGWEIGATEAGDPQLYLLGSGPAFDCVLCVSRLGRVYVLENGQGDVLGEYRTAAALADAARASFAGFKHRLAVRVALAWAAAREAIEDKLEPLTEEPAQAVAHLVPQLAALA